MPNTGLSIALANFSFDVCFLCPWLLTASMLMFKNSQGNGTCGDRWHVAGVQAPTFDSKK